MIQTVYNQALKFNVDSTTVRVNPGTARLGLNIVPFRGGSMDFGIMTHLSAGEYQYSALALVEQQGAHGFIGADLTSVYSDSSSNPLSLLYPKFDTTNFCPIGLFLFSSDGTVINLKEASEVTN